MLDFLGEEVAQDGSDDHDQEDLQECLGSFGKGDLEQIPNDEEIERDDDAMDEAAAEEVIVLI